MSEAEQPVVVEVETEARSQGWVPKEEYRGPETDWIDAETFVKRGKEINPILRKNNERIQKELDLTKKQMEELRAATEEFKQFQKEAFEKKLDKYKEEISDLRELKKKAIAESNGELAVEIEEKIDAVKEARANAEAQAKEKKPEAKPEVTAPEVNAWVEKNSWYKEDTRMQQLTNTIAQSIRNGNPSLTGKEFLAELDKQLEETFPLEKLGRKAKPRNPVEGNRPAAPQNKGEHSYDSLPPEAKAACDKFVKQKILTREQYIADYYA